MPAKNRKHTLVRYKSTKITIPARLIPHIQGTLVCRLYDDNIQQAVIHMVQNALQDDHMRRMQAKFDEMIKRLDDRAAELSAIDAAGRK